MSRSRELQLHIEQLDEIREILNAMKNLAFMAVHKLAHLQELQSQVVAHISDNAAAFLNAYPHLIETATEKNLPPVYLVIGSERGFCGDFNERLLDSLINQPCRGIIAVGSRLLGCLDSYPYPVLASFPGANAEEEISAVLEQIFDQLDSLQDHQTVIALYHDHENNQIQQRRILPPLSAANASLSSPPQLILNLAPELFFAELSQQFILAALHEILTLSLLTENRLRLQHLEGAVQHLDEQSGKLHRKWQTYRQEEITEEIEVILLNTDSV
jgi:F-type H+-transporting ATPase subunit gamma